MPRHRFDAPTSGRTDSAFKWVVRITSLFALVFAVVQAVRLVSDVNDRRRQIGELMRVQQLQAQSKDYPGAWTTLGQALKVAESGGQLAKLTGQVGADIERVRQAQEDFAMTWVEDLSAPTPEKYSALVAELTPVMTRGVAASTNGRRRADLQAHIGWATLSAAAIKGTSPSEPGLETPCRAALAEDRANPYAHACVGYWMLWTGRPIAEGMQEFETAIAADRARPFVRQVQRAALKRRGENAESTIVAVANEMRKHGEPMQPAVRSDVAGVYWFACGTRENADAMRALTAVVPAAEQVATYQAMFIDSAERDGDAARQVSHQACFATLLEAAGERERALASWRNVREALGSSRESVLAPRADAAIKRLGGHPND